MVHQLEFAKSFPVQHCHESIKRKFCCEDEEDTIKQVSLDFLYIHIYINIKNYKLKAGKKIFFFF